MANFGPSKTWTDGEILSHTDLNAALLDIINNVTNNNIDADNIDETDDYTWSGANSFVGGHSIKVLSNAASSIVTGTTLEWDPGDGGQMTDNSSGISLDFKLPDASDNQDVFASIAAICLDDAAGSEDGELSFRVATAGTNTEKMTLSSTALTVTPAITASGGITGSVTSSNVSITGGSITGITDIAIADGGTGASTAAAARTNLGLEIGVDVQAYDAELQALSGLTPTDSNIIVGNGSTFVTESGATARTSLGLGSIATQSASAVSITGGSLTGMTSYSGGTISGTTGTFSGAVNANNLVLAASNSYPILLENQDGTTADAAISTYDDANGTLLALGSNFYYNSGAEARFNTSEEAAGIVLNRTGTISLRTSDGSNNTVERVSVGNTGDFAVNTSQLFVDQSTARVGINTNSPKDTLHVKLGTNLNWQFGYPNNSVTTLAALNDAESAYVTARIDAGTLELNGQSGGDVNICAGGLFVDASADRVGINTASPLSGLHISDGVAYGSPQNASRKATLTISAGTEASADLQFLNANYNHIFFGDSADANVGALLYDHTNNSMQFAVNGSERARITSAGNLTLQTNQAADTALAIYNTNSSASAKASLKVGYDSANHLHIYRIGNSASIVYNATQSGSNHQFLINSKEAARFTQSNGSGGLTLKSNAGNNLIVMGPEGSGGNEENAYIAGFSNGTQKFALGLSTGPSYLNTGQNFGIGTASPVALSNQTSLTINGTSVGRVDVKAGGGGGGVMFGTSSALTVQANSGVAVNLDSASGQPITFQVGSSEKARILSSGGITFNGDTAAANALDDYEEGTWTPTFTPSTSGSITLAAGGGAYYTKIGQLVTATLSVTVASVSSPIGYVSVNLPFAPNTSNQKGRSAVAVYVDGLAAGHNTRDAIALTEDSSASLRIYQGDSNSNQADFAQAVGAGTYFNLTVSYIV